MPSDPKPPSPHPTPLETLAALHQCAASWEPDARLVGNVRAGDIVTAALHAMSAVNEQYRHSACVACGCDLILSSEAPHCFDCVPTDEQREAWESGGPAGVATPAPVAAEGLTDCDCGHSADDHGIDAGCIDPVTNAPSVHSECSECSCVRWQPWPTPSIDKALADLNAAVAARKSGDTPQEALENCRQTLIEFHRTEAKRLEEMPAPDRVGGDAGEAK